MAVLAQQALQQTCEIKPPQGRNFICSVDPILYFDHNELFHNTSIIKLTNSHSASPMFIWTFVLTTNEHVTSHYIDSSSWISPTQTHGHSAQLYTYSIQYSCYMFWLQATIFRKSVTLYINQCVFEVPLLLWQDLTLLNRRETKP